jgi:C1A family cysteine protease
MKSAVFASALVVASAETVNLSFKDCGSSSTHGKINSLSPDSIQVPGKSTVVGTGSLDADQTSASFSLKVKKGIIPFLSGKGNLCEDTVINLPLGAGSFTVKAMSCPVKAGDVSVEVDLDLASSLFEDGENSLATIHIDANADDTGDQVLCLDIDASLGSANWEDFKVKYGKVYNGAEHEAEHKQVYSRNMRWAAENSNEETTFGENQFSDLSQEQYRVAAGLGYKPNSLSSLPHLGVHVHDGSELADSVDWTTKGAVTPVKDQGQCGSCWAFSTTGGLEGAWQIASGSLKSLSEQQFVDCDKSGSAGCQGGDMATAFQWAENQALASEDSYPYTARDGSCKSSGFTTAIPQGGVTGYKSVGQSTADLKSALNLGPVSVAIEADQMAFQMYSGGVLKSGCGTNLDHGVLAVGYTADAFKVKNSWGSSWGSSGYLQISTEGNVCGIHSEAQYPTVSASVTV